MYAEALTKPTTPVVVLGRLFPYKTLWRAESIDGVTVLVHTPEHARTRDVEAYLASDPEIRIVRTKSE